MLINRIAATGVYGPQRAPASVKANKSANGSMVESRSRKPKALCRHGDKGERNTSSLDEGGLLMEARRGSSGAIARIRPRESLRGRFTGPRGMLLWTKGSGRQERFECVDKVTCHRAIAFSGQMTVVQEEIRG